MRERFFVFVLAAVGQVGLVGRCLPPVVGASPAARLMAAVRTDTD